MKKKLIKYLVIVSFVFLVAIILGIYLYNKPHENISNKSPDYVINALELYNEFETNEEAANQKYLDRILQVSGTITDITNENDQTFTFVLSDPGKFGGVSFSINKEALNGNSYDKGDLLSVKGKCTGMLMEVVLTNCSIID